MTEVLHRVVAAIEAVNTKPAQKSGKGYRLQCPAHNGKDRNLYIADGDERLLITCHSHHCDPKDILEAAGLSIQDVYYQQFSPKQQQEYRVLVTDKQIKKELELELLILLLWIADSYQNLFPIALEADQERVKLAIVRVANALTHLRGTL